MVDLTYNNMFRTRMVAQPEGSKSYLSLADAVRKLNAEGGISAFYKGTVPSSQWCGSASRWCGSEYLFFSLLRIQSQIWFFTFDADLDIWIRLFNLMRIRILLFTLSGSRSSSTWCESATSGLQTLPGSILNLHSSWSFDFDADPDPAFDFDADPNPAFHSDANPDPASQNDPDPCYPDSDPQHCWQHK